MAKTKRKEVRIFSTRILMIQKKKGGEFNMLKSKIASVVTTGALLIATASPAFAADSLQITGNGAASVNTTNVNQTTTTTATQTNNANVVNNVTSKANSGGNSSDFNTGGSTTVVSGPAVSNSDVTTAVNANNLSLDNCNCAGGAKDVTISGNGATSFNTANLNATNTTVATQNNAANVVNNVENKATSGDNHTSFNTGGGTVISTGAAQANTHVTTAANVNTASFGGNALSGAGNGASALITGNGAASVNDVNLNIPSTVVLAQNNSAQIVNNVESKANSGKNSSDFNTGGSTAVVAGPAIANTTVDNLANFNAADLDCGCITSGVNAKIGGNGATGFNTINANLASVLGLTQGNGAALLNNTDSKANSGDNGAAFNTGTPSSDPAVITTGSLSNNSVSNLANWNGAGAGSTLNMPGGSSLNLLMDFSSLLSLLHWM